MLSLALVGISAQQGADISMSLSTLWQYFIVFLYATAHKLGLVSIALALFHYFLPVHWPKPILTLIAGFVLALLYNLFLLYGTESHQLISQLNFAQVFQQFIIYYCIGGMAIGLIGSVLCKRLLAKNRLT